MALEHNAYLGRDDLGKLLRSFSLPCILSLLVSALYNIVDQIFIGNSELGYLGNAATGVVFPLLMVAMAFGWCVGDGCAAYLSLCQGKGDAQSAHRCVGSGITMTFAASVFLMIVCGIWQEPLLRLFGASDTTIGMAMEYFTILLGAFPFYMLTNSTNGSIRADGSPKYAMLSTVSALGAQNIGAQKPERALQTLRYAIMLTVSFGVIVCGIVQLSAEPIVALFTDSEAVGGADVIRLGGQYLRGYIWDCIFAGIHFSFSGYFCACGKSALSFLHNILAVVLVRVPGAYLTSQLFPDTLFPMGLVNMGGSLLSVCICLIAFTMIRRREKRTEVLHG